MPIPTANRKNSQQAASLIGKRFGKLIVIRLATEGEKLWYKYFRAPKHIGTIFFCKCDCGNYKLAKLMDLNRNHAKSCGCYKHEFLRKRLSYGEAAINDFFAKYKKAASERELKFELSREDFEILIKKDCVYCGLPAQDRQIQNRTFFGGLIANGIDRIDSSLGYSLNNCVPCCSQCNIAKCDFSLEEFKNWICRAYNHLSSSSKEYI